MVDWHEWVWISLAVLFPLMGNGLVMFLGKKRPGVAGRQSSSTEIQNVEDINLPARLRSLREQRLNQIQKFGLSHTHNEKCCRRGTTCYSSHYLSDCGRYLYSDCIYTGLAARILTGSKTLAAVRSVCEDGTVIETSSHKTVPRVMRGISNHVPLRLAVAGSVEPDVLLQKHREFVDEQLEESGNELMVLLPEMIPDVEEYSLQLVDQFLYERGLLPEPPQPLTFASSDDSTDRETATTIS